MTDARWLVLELGPHAEGEDPDVVRRSIQHVVRNAEVFIPAVVTLSGANRVFQYVVEGYAFVREDRPQNAFLKLLNTRFVQSVLMESTRRRNGTCSFATVSDVEIDRMRKRIQREVDQDICVGDTVMITSGPYKEIEGTVIEDLPETKSVQVYVRLRSKEAIITLPRSFLRLVAHQIRPKLLDLLPAFQKWTGAVRTLVEWSVEGHARVESAFQVWAPLEYRRQKADVLTDIYLESHKLPLDTSSLAASALRWVRMHEPSHRLEELLSLVETTDHVLGVPVKLTSAVVPWYRLAGWVDRLGHTAHVPAADSVLYVGSMAYAAVRYVRLQDFQVAWRGVTEAMYDFGAQLSLLEDRMIDNVLIDGFNLAFRCRFAPSLRDLKDARGRPTGIIFGYLRSLGSLQKRFPKAVLHVCWDGSSKRRKAAYEGYKANRPQRGDDGFDQVGYLRGFLPLVGVVQHWNPDEEADDVIATLVSGVLADDRNVIVSTDRDLLQLVGRTTVVLTPAVGAGKERLFDEDEVVGEYGVTPEKLPHLRAMTGDTSDNLPGVVRVPVKILSALVRSHGTVDGIYSSGLPGLTKSQYTKLKEAEEQVRMNVDLMTLRDVAVIRTDPNPDQILAEARLGDVGVKPEAISVFFGDAAGFFKEGSPRRDKESS